MSTKKTLLTILIFAVALTAAIPFIGHARKVEEPSRADITKLRPKIVKEPLSISTEDEPHVLSLEVTPSGFQPSEAIAPRGRFLILLQNRTGRRDLNFWLVPENQQRVAESIPERRDWKAHVQLGPGTYIIGETNHPQWQFTLRVTN